MGHETRVKEMISNGWIEGEEYKSRSVKSDAKISVMRQLQKSCNMEMSKAVTVLSSILADLRSEGLDEFQVLSNETKEKYQLSQSIAQSISSFVGSLGNAVISNSTHILTGLTAVLAPQRHPGTGDLISARMFSEYLGLNRDSKYYKSGVKICRTTWQCWRQYRCRR